MIDTLYYINESRGIKNSLSNYIESVFLAMPQFSSYKNTVTKTVKTEKMEMLRAKFGDSSIFIKSVKDLLNTAFPEAKFDISLCTKNNNPVSKKFESCEITPKTNIIYNYNGNNIINKGYSFYITNRNMTILNKSLTPQALGLSDKEMSKNELVDAVKSSISNQIQSKAEYELFIYLIDKVSENTQENSISLEDLLSSTESKVIKFSKNDLPKEDPDKLDQKDFEELDESSISVIENDFGEILGALFLLSYIKNAKKVIYPSTDNEPLIDYNIFIEDIKYGISAKASGGKGHNPSAIVIIQQLSDFIEGGEVFDADGNKITMQNLFDVCDDIDKNEAMEFFKMLSDGIKDKSKGIIRRQSIDLIEKYCNKKATATFCNYFLKGSNIQELKNITDKQFEEIFNEKFNKEKGRLVSVQNQLERESNHKTNNRIKDMTSVSDFNTTQKIGMFLYPMCACAVDTINNKFATSKSNKLDIVSGFIQLAFTHKQIYTGIKFNKAKGEFSLSFICKSMNKGNWKFKYGGSSNEPYQTSLGVKMY